MRHRPSSVRAYDKCPFRAQKQYYSGEERVGLVPEEFRVGQALHQLAAARLLGKPEMFNEAGQWDPDVVAEATVLAHGLETYLPEGAKIITIEKPFAHTENGIEIVGIPDGTLEYSDSYGPPVVAILDWKSAWTAQGYEREQFLDYAALITTDAIIPRVNEIERRTVFLRMSYAATERITWEAAEKHMGSLILKCGAIEKDLADDVDLAATPGTHCNDCQIANICPLPDEQIIRAGAIRNADLAYAAAQHVVATEARIKQIKENLKKWCSEAGAIDLGAGSQYGFVTGEKRSFDNEKLANALGPGTIQELLEEGYLKIETKKLGKLKREDEEIHHTIEEAMSTKPTTTFKVHKK